MLASQPTDFPKDDVSQTEQEFRFFKNTRRGLVQDELYLILSQTMEKKEVMSKMKHWVSRN